MSTCPKYRQIAESHFALFCRLNAREFDCDTRPLRADEREELRLAMADLDDHIAMCPVCGGDNPPHGERLSRFERRKMTG